MKLNHCSYIALLKVKHILTVDSYENFKILGSKNSEQVTKNEKKRIQKEWIKREKVERKIKLNDDSILIQSVMWLVVDMITHGKPTNHFRFYVGSQVACFTHFHLFTFPEIVCRTTTLTTLKWIYFILFYFILFYFIQHFCQHLEHYKYINWFIKTCPLCLSKIKVLVKFHEMKLSMTGGDGKRVGGGGKISMHKIWVQHWLRWFIPAFRATIKAFLCLKSTQNY